MNFEELYESTCASVSVAVRSGNIQKLKDLLAQGKSSCIEDNRGWRALHHAVDHGHLECVKLLLKAPDVDINAMTFERRTALTQVVHSSAEKTVLLEIAKVLLEAGADPNAENQKQNCTLLNYAIQIQWAEFIKLLIDYKVDMNERYDTTSSTLNTVALYGNVEILQLVLKQEIILNPSKRERGIFLDLIMKIDRPTSVKMEMLKCCFKKPECLAAINDVNGVWGLTPLMRACIDGWREGIHLLLDHGADPNTKRRDRSPLIEVITHLHFKDSEVEEEDSVFARLYRLTCNKLKRSSTRVSFFHCLAAIPDKTKTLSFVLNEDPGLNLDSHLEPLFASWTHNRPYSFDFVDDCFFQAVLDGERGQMSPLAVWCAVNDRPKDWNMFLLLFDQAKDINDTSSGRIPPLISSLIVNGASNIRPVQLSTIRYLLTHGADVMVEPEGAEHQISTAFLVAMLHTTSTCLQYLLLHSVPAEILFTEESFKTLITCMARVVQHIRAMPLYYEDNFIDACTSWILQWVTAIDKFMPRLPLQASKISSIFRYKESNTNKILELTDSVQMLMSTPKRLSVLAALRVRLSLWENRKQVPLCTSVDDLCGAMKFSSAMKRLLMLDMDHQTAFESEEKVKCFDGRKY